MRPPRLSLRALNIYTNGASPVVPTCQELRLSAVLESEGGAHVKREETLLVYHAILGDAEQLPSMIAEALRSMMLRADYGGCPEN